MPKIDDKKTKKKIKFFPRKLIHNRLSTKCVKNIGMSAFDMDFLFFPTELNQFYN